MSVRSIRQILVVAFGVSISSLALARTPPSLVMQQQAAARATESSGGYRDMNLRFGSVAERAPAARLASGGYRDMHHRFQTPSEARGASSSRTSASLR
ncbi:MAG: hypothetical protein EOO73_10565 [Myxococcales bacterium]|nr:MAG: hypothetical protein EOO73_10565 [Myxococcales bacterium]